ncbi:MAG: hypothetical protein Q9184_004290 [Pyrenodesmia sp. 2 TL-2023]
MPAASSKPPAKRGRPAFKTPRPAASKSSKPKATPRRKSAPATTTLTSSNSEEDVGSLTNGESSDSEVNTSETVEAPSGTQDPPPAIPPKLLTRLLHHHLEEKEGGIIKIGKDANALVGKYMETFVREAIARAAFERSQADEGAGMGDGFLERLQVEDLEKLAPQLLLDF